MERIPIASAHAKFVLLEEFFPVTHKRGKGCLGRIEDAQSELISEIRINDLLVGRSTRGAYKIRLGLEGDGITEFG
jgi:hypothetical protein